MNNLQSPLEAMKISNELLAPLFLCAILILVAVVIKFVIPWTSVLYSDSRNPQQHNKTEGQPSGSKSKHLGNVRRRRHTNSLEEHGGSPTVRSTSKQKGNWEQRRASSTNRKKKADNSLCTQQFTDSSDALCTDLKSHTLNSRDSRPSDVAEHSPVVSRRPSPCLISEPVLSDQAAPFEEWKSVVRKPKKGRKPLKVSGPEKSPDDPSAAPHVGTCVKEEPPRIPNDASPSLSPPNALQPVEEVKPLQNELPSQFSVSPTYTTPQCLTEIPPIPSTLGNQSEASELTRPRRKRRARQGQTLPTGTGATQIELNLVTSGPDPLESKASLEDSEFEVVEDPCLLSCSPCHSSESDQAVTEPNPEVPSSISVEIPSISSIEQFPCLPGSEDQFVGAPRLAALDAREGGRHPQAVRLLTSALGDNGGRSGSRRTMRSKARKAD